MGHSTPSGYDAHCHLDFDALSGDLMGHLERARRAGIHHWHVPGCGPSQWVNLEALRHVPGVSLGLGVHPWWCREVADIGRTMGDLDQQWQTLGAVALGECGLDRQHERRGGTSLERQEEIFRAQLSLAREKGVPVVLHVVGAHDRALRILTNSPPVAGMVHGFTGAFELAERYLRLGLSIGIGAAVTSTRSRRVRETATRVLLRDLLLETDAPDQAPRGSSAGDSRRSGVPADWLRIAREVAELRRADLTTIVADTARNAHGLFGGGVCQRV